MCGVITPPVAELRDRLAAVAKLIAPALAMEPIGRPFDEGLGDRTRAGDADDTAAVAGQLHAETEVLQVGAAFQACADW